MKSNKHNLQLYKPLIVYFIVWLISYAAFFMMSPGDAFGYGVVFLWGVLPVTAIVSSIFVGKNKILSNRAIIPIGIYYGVLYMMAPYMTFTMANCRAQIAAVRNGFPMPDVTLFVMGVLFFSVGYMIGKFIDKARR